MHVLFHVCPLCMWRQLKSCMGMVDSATTADKTAQRCPAQKAAELTDQMQTTANSRMFYFHFSTQKFYCVLTSDKPSLVSLALVSTQGFFSFWIPANNENYCKKKTLLLNKNTLKDDVTNNSINYGVFMKILKDTHCPLLFFLRCVIEVLVRVKDFDSSNVFWTLKQTTYSSRNPK